MRNNSGARPVRDPVTGKGHIMNWENPAYGYRRCCSYCYCPIARDIPEHEIEKCSNCGIGFDHGDDDPVDDPELYD